MKWKTTLVLLVVTVGIGAYVSLYELKQPTPEARTRLAKQVLQINPDDVTSLIVAFPAAGVTLERTQNAWRLISPRDARADEALIHRVLTALDPLDSEQILSSTKEHAPALADYGLQPSQATLTVVTPQRSAKLLFGEATAVADHRYVMVEGFPNVFVVSSEMFETLDQPLEAFRSPDLLNFNTWDVRQISVTSSLHSYTLTKPATSSETESSDRWRLTAPLDDVADGGAVSTTLSKLRGLRIERVIADELAEADRARYGLDAPYATIAIRIKEDQPPLELTIGKVTAENDRQRYAKRSDESTVYAVTSSQIDEVVRDPHALRSRACFEFFASQVTKLHLTSEEVSWALERQGETWKASDLPAPASEPSGRSGPAPPAGGAQAGGIDLDGAAVEEFLWKIRDVQLTRFVDDAPHDLVRYGLEPAKGVIQVWLSGQAEPQTLSIGSTVETGTTRFGRITGRQTIVELPEAVNEILTQTPDAFKPKPSESQPDAQTSEPKERLGPAPATP